MFLQRSNCSLQVPFSQTASLCTIDKGIEFTTPKGLNSVLHDVDFVTFKNS